MRARIPVPRSKGQRRGIYLLAVAAAAASLLFITLQLSVASVFRTRMPQVATAWWSFDAEANARLAYRSVIAQPEPSRLATAEAQALGALKRDPTMVVALRTLGIVEDIRNNRKEALRLIKSAETLSRRDLETQIWLIEYSSRSGDVPATLHHYDTALRTSSRSRNILFPILITATEDPALVQPIADVLKRRPSSWWWEFTNELIAKGKNPDHTAAIITQVLSPKVPLEADYLGDLLERLISQRAYPTAWRTYAKINGAAADSVALVRNGAFSTEDPFPPIDWQLMSEPDVEVSKTLKPGSRSDPALFVRAVGSSNAVAARQLLKLAPGAYRMAFDTGVSEGQQGAPVSVRIACIGSNADTELVALSRPATSSTTARLSGGFVVPASCAWQWLQVRPGSSPSSAAAWVDNLTIMRQVAR